MCAKKEYLRFYCADQRTGRVGPAGVSTAGAAHPYASPCRRGSTEANAPAMNCLGLDPYHQIGFGRQAHRAVLWVFVAQIAKCQHVFVRSIDDSCCAVDEDEGELIPLLFIVIDQ